MKQNNQPTLVHAEGTKKQDSVQSTFLNRILENEALADSLCCLFLSVGVSLSLLTLTELEFTLRGTLGLCALSVLAIAVFRFRWWILPVLGTLVLGGTIAVQLYHGDLDIWAAHWLGMLRWLLQGALYHPLYSEAGGLVLLQLLIILAVVLLLYPLARLPVLFPGVTALSLAVILFTNRLRPGDLSVSLCVWAAGIVLLLPGFYAWVVRRRSGSGESRARMQMIALPAALLAVLLSLAITPEDTASWRSQGLVNLVADIRALFTGPYASYPASSANFSLADLGFQAEKERMGGPVTLNNRTALTVTTPSPVLLKGRVLDYYDGKNWGITAPDGDFRYGSLFWRGYRREAFNLDKPRGGAEARRIYNAITTQIDVTVLHDNNRYTSVFVGGRPGKVAFADSALDSDGFFNMRSELYLHYRIPSRQRYTQTVRVWNRNLPDFDGQFLRLEQAALQAEDEQLALLLERYTALPDTLPDSVHALALEITAEAETPYQQALALGEWLIENCTYTLEPDIPPEGEDFVAHFLDTREGYCTYYASTLAVMARSLGIPSRYVMGFGLERQKADLFLATGRTAHAWVELYFSGIGWVEMDPLSWNADAPLNQPDEEEEAAPIQYPPATPPNLPPDEQEQSQFPVSGAASPDDETAESWLPLLAALLGILAAYILARLLIRRARGGKLRAYALNRVMRKHPERMDALEHFYRDILRQLALLGMTPQPGETLLTFPKRVDKRIQLDGVTLREVADARIALHFAGKAPDMEAIRGTCLYHEKLEELLYERLGKAVYLFRRGSLWP